MQIEALLGAVIMIGILLGGLISILFLILHIRIDKIVYKFERELDMLKFEIGRNRRN